MKRVLTIFVIFSLSISAYAAKWNQITGDDLKTLYQDSVMTGHHKGSSYTIHYCADGRRSFLKLGNKELKERAQTFPNEDEVCIEDDKGKRCYHVFQHAKKPEKLKYKGTNVSSSGKQSLTNQSPDWCN